ncbi:MAG TPA: PAS domain S-box protein, partial [Chitinophagaceae bacterium]|nr:PAS domain S-box protein [Chitinophagaceae bacterium]
AQERVVETFHFALKPGGFLFLGSSEAIDGAGDLFAQFNKDYHIFQSRQVSARSYAIPESVHNFTLPQPRSISAYQEAENRAMERITFGDLHQRLLEQYAPPSLVVNEEYDIVHVSDRAGRYLSIAGGEPSQNLLKLIRPELRLELRAALYQAVQRKSAVELRSLKVSLENTEAETINLHVKPVLREDDIARGFILVVFEPTKARAEEQIVLSADEPVARQLEEQLIRLKTQLRNSIEQYEFQAEELKASNEELQAMNEELRSAAEELETSKEELQSINEELSTVNQELKVKIEETTLSGNNLQNLINSTDIGTIFLDRGFRLMFFTPAATHIFNLIQTDFGRPLTDITSRLDYKSLLEDAEAVMETLQSIEREVRTTEGKTFLMRILPYRTGEDRINGVVISFIDISTRKTAEQKLLFSESRLADELNVLNRLHDLSLELLTSPDLHTAAQKTLLVICRLVNASLGTLQLYQADMGGLQYAAEYGEDAEALAALPVIKEVFSPADALKSGKRLVVADFLLMREHPHKLKIVATGYRAAYTATLYSGGGQLAGVITIYFKYPHDPNDRELHAVDLYAAQAARFIERKQAEENLRASEQRFRILNDAVTQLIWANDEKGVANYFNQRWFEYSGLSFHESFGKCWEAIIHPDDAATSIQQWHKDLENGEVFDAEFRLRRQDGIYRWHIARNIPMKNNEGKITGWFGSATDIDDLKTAVQSLNESRERLRVTLESSTDFAIIAADKAGVITSWNKAAHYLLGFEEQEAIGQKTSIFFTPEDVANNMPAKEMMTAAEKGRAVDERWHQHKDGTRVFLSGVLSPMYNADELTGYLKVARDITAQKKYEEALKALEERYRIALASAAMGTWDWNIQEDSITWNEQYYQLMGLTPQNKPVTVAEFIQYVHPEDQELVTSRLQQAIRNTDIYHAEFRILQDKKEVRWMSGYGRAIGNGQTPATRMVGVMHDITERKKLEKEKEEFINIASHEIKTPLTSIKAYAELLQSMFEESSEEKHAQYMQKMNLQIDRLNDLISDLLDTTKVAEGQLPLKLQTFDLNELVAECADDLKHLSGQHRLVLRTGAIAAVTADRERISQVLVNLINNAIKYSPSGGDIEITTSGDTHFVTTSVTDHGVGIPADMQQKVFDRFFRVSNASGNTAPGMGLGLYISAGIVQRHGGTISVQSNECSGTTFSFTLPYKAKNQAN